MHCFQPLQIRFACYEFVNFNSYGYKDRCIGIFDLESSEKVARVALNFTTKQVLDINIYQTRLRFKCKRCATFCCKLGGPKLTEKDVERIKKAGYLEEKFLEPILENEFKGNLKSRQDGSCIFLKFDTGNNRYECSIYDFRPALCRLFPFHFDKMSPNFLLLGLIPCCRGLNNPEGKPINEKFIVDNLLDALLDLTASSAIR